MSNWVRYQRGHKSKLSDDCKAKLDNLGFVWKAKDTWPEKHQELVQWLMTHLKYPARSSTNLKEKQLSAWVCYQRQHKHKLTDDRKKKLDAMGFVWSVKNPKSQNDEKKSSDEELPEIILNIPSPSMTEVSQMASPLADSKTSEEETNKRKSSQTNESHKKKPRTFMSQLQAEKDKIAQKQQLVEEAVRLDLLSTPTQAQQGQLDVLKRQLGMLDETYNETNHSETHAAWKQSMNMVFTELLNDFTQDGDNILYLDAEQQHTTTAIRSRFQNRRKLFVANWSQETCSNLKTSGTIDEVEHGSLNDLLNNQWKTKLFSAAYLDLCCGSASAISQVLSALLHSKHSCKVVGFTLTQRDPEGHNQVERLDRLEAFLRELCPRMSRVADLPKCKDTIWTENGVVTRFYVL